LWAFKAARVGLVTNRKRSNLGYNSVIKKMEENCIFCKIINGNAGTEIVYQDDQVTAFHDQQPSAPVHVLIVPNRHIASFNDASEDDEAWLSRVFFVARQLAEQMDIQQSGYRLVLNTGPDAGQSVFHLHFHLMGGQRLSRLSR
jgi:histidine triad (HIT) family protein